MKSRRKFLGELTTVGVVYALCPSLSLGQKPSGVSQEKRRTNKGGILKARVVLVESPGLKHQGVEPDRATLRRMLDLGLRRLADTADVRAALQRWVRPVDTAGLKVNCMAGRQMSTHLELVEELIGLLEKIGLPRKQTIVFDRSDGDLRRAGFSIQSNGSNYRCLGNDRAGYEPNLTVMPNGASRFSRIASQMASVLINLPILKDHGIAGVSGALKNNFGLVHNPNKYHLNGCNPHVAEVNAQPLVRNKQRLIIADALRVQTDGGPGYYPAAAENFGGLLFATDPVALDIIAWEILERLRHQRKLPTLAEDKRRPVHIFGAARQGLGVEDRSKIELIQVKVS